MALGSQALCDLLKMLTLKQHSNPVVDRFPIVEEIEFRRVDGKPSGL